MSNDIPNAVKEQYQNLPKIQQELSHEEIYRNLNAAINHALIVIRWLIWPAATIMIGVGIFLGWQTYLKLNQVDELKNEIFAKKNEVSDLVFKIQDQRIDLDEKQKDLQDQQSKLEKDIEDQSNNIVKLRQRTTDVTNRSGNLLTNIDNARLQVENLLNKTQQRLDQQNNFLEKNKKDINSALVAISDKEKILSELKKEREEELNKIRNINSLFVEYQIYQIKGSNTLPDPYLKDEVDILNKIAELIYPDTKSRVEFVSRLTEILNKKQ